MNYTTSDVTTAPVIKIDVPMGGSLLDNGTINGSSSTGEEHYEATDETTRAALKTELFSGINMEDAIFLGWQSSAETYTNTTGKYITPNQTVDTLLTGVDILTDYTTITTTSPPTFKACYYKLNPETSNGILIQCQEDFIYWQRGAGYYGSSSKPMIVTQDITVNKEEYNYRYFTATGGSYDRYEMFAPVVGEEEEGDVIDFHLYGGSASFNSAQSAISSVNTGSTSTIHTITLSKHNLNNQSLIGYLYGGSTYIKYLTFDFCNTTTSEGAPFITTNAGDLVLSYITIKRLNIVNTAGTGAVGFLVGNADRTTYIDHCTVQDCTIDVKTDTSVGSLVGTNYLYGDFDYGYNTVQNVSIRVGYHTKTSLVNVGGHVGSSEKDSEDDSIYNCTVDGLTISTSATVAAVGGVVGRCIDTMANNYGTRDCYVNNLTINNAQASYVGGIIGRLIDGNCHGDQVVNSSITTNGSVGGIVGYAEGTASITGDNHSYTNLFDMREFGLGLMAGSIGETTMNGAQLTGNICDEIDIYYTTGAISTSGSSYEEGGDAATFNFSELTLWVGGGAQTATVMSRATYLVPVAPSTTYTISWWGEDYEGEWGYGNMGVYFRTSLNGTHSSNTSSSYKVGRTGYDGHRCYLTFTTSSTAKYAAFSCIGESGGTTFSDIQLVYGTTYKSAQATTYAVHNTKIQCTATWDEDVVCTGGVVGHMLGTSYVENIVVNGLDIDGAGGVGGIVGVCASTNGRGLSEDNANKFAAQQYVYSSAAISHCIASESNITSFHSTASVYGTGGIVGYVSSGGAIIACESLDNSVGSTGTGTGGIVGQAYETMINYCKNTSTVSTQVPSGTNTCLGGIVGHLDSGNKGAYVYNCTNSGMIWDEQANCIGGIVGYASDWNYYFIGIHYCQNTGEIEGGEYIGGIVGYMTGEEPYVGRCINNAAIIGYSYVGGIIGSNASNCGYVGYCINTGIVSGTTNKGPISGDTWGSSDNVYLQGTCVANGSGTEKTADQITYYLDDGKNSSSSSYAYEIVRYTPAWGTSSGAGAYTEANRNKSEYYCPKIAGANGSSYVRIYDMASQNTDNLDLFEPVVSGSNVIGFAIKSLADLQTLHRAMLNAEVSPTLGKKYSRCNYYLFESVTTALTTPIGYSTNSANVVAFEGTFQGASYASRTSHTASDGSTWYTYNSPTVGTKLIKLSISKSSYDYIGLFAKTTGAKIQYITISSGSSVSGKGYVGGLVGEATRTTFSNCINNANITGAANYIGGIAGRFAGVIPDSGTNVDNVSNGGTVTGSSTSERVGGLFGSSTNLVLKTGSNSGAVTGSKMVGGITGASDYGTIESATNTGAVKSSSTWLGGITGYVASATIASSTNSGAVSVTAATQQIGGIAGAIAGTTTIRGNTNKGAITSSSASSFIGGIIGNVYSSTDEKSVYANIQQANITAESSTSVGGLIGQVSGGTINIYGNKLQGGAIKGGYSVGGLIGCMSGGALYGDETTGTTITSTSSSASVSGRQNVGGFVGYLQGTATLGFKFVNTTSSGTTKTQMTAYKTGYMINTSPVSGYMNVGGIVGTAINTQNTIYNSSGALSTDNTAIYYVKNAAAVTCLGKNSSYNSTLGSNIKWTKPVAYQNGLGVETTLDSVYQISSGNYQANIGGIAGKTKATSLGYVLNSGNVTTTSSISCVTSISANEQKDILGYNVPQKFSVTISSGALAGFGGIVGRAETGSGIYYAAVSGCSIGAADNTNFTTSSGIVMVGGIVGYLQGESLIGVAVAASSVGNIVQSTKIGVATISGAVWLRGGYFMGAAVGYADGSETFSLISTSTIWTDKNGSTVSLAGLYILNIAVEMASGSSVKIKFKNQVSSHSISSPTSTYNTNRSRWAAHTNSRGSGIGVLALTANAYFKYATVQVLEGDTVHSTPSSTNSNPLWVT